MPRPPSLPSPEAVSGVIVAGGKSTRFGADKASAVVGGRTLLEWVAAGIAPACERMVIVRAKGQAVPRLDIVLPTRVVDDEYDAKGPLAGLVAGFAAVETPLAFAASCDVPLVRASLVAGLASLARDFDVVVPHVEGYPQPLLSIYRPATCLPAFREAVDDQRLKITAAYAGLRVRVVRETEVAAFDPGLRSFRNVNRAGDLAELAARLSSGT